MDDNLPIVKEGGFRYPNSSVYVGTWNNEGIRQGEGHLVLQNGTRYDGNFENGLFTGKGILTFPDGAKYEGEFFNGWFHGFGVFWRADGTRFEGEFLGGRICGKGLLTFGDDTNGFPRLEGVFDNCKLLRRMRCDVEVQTAQKAAFIARKTYLK